MRLNAYLPVYMELFFEFQSAFIRSHNGVHRCASKAAAFNGMDTRNRRATRGANCVFQIAGVTESEKHFRRAFQRLRRI